MSQSIDRRSLLKLFGIGAVVVPVVNGIPSEGSARIIQPSGIEIIERAPVTASRSIQEVFCAGNPVDVVVFIREKSGNTFRMECSSFLTDMNFDVRPVYSLETLSSVTSVIQTRLKFEAISNAEVKLV